MERIDLLWDSYRQPYFPLQKYGYSLGNILNNANRWHTKLVCSILDRNAKPYVSTTYARQNDYLRLLETTTYLGCNRKLSPHIVRIYPEDKSIVCDYIGEYLSDYLLGNPGNIPLSINSVFKYLKDINSINQSQGKLIIPTIIAEAFQLIEEFPEDFIFLSRIKATLPQLVDSDIKFIYGCGIEDPHIWNFRILNSDGRVKALTTDFDYFQDKINCFWELGYFYATFRWLEKESLALAHKAEKRLLSITETLDLKSKFMFWLGALSSFCGYKDSLLNLARDSEIANLQQQNIIIQGLDEKVSYLANQLLSFSPDKDVISIKQVKEANQDVYSQGPISQP